VVRSRGAVFYVLTPTYWRAAAAESAAIEILKPKRKLPKHFSSA